jgi:anti-anti-sigma factor
MEGPGVFRKGVHELGQLLLTEGLVTEDDLARALAEQKRRQERGEPYRRLGELLVEQGAVPAEKITEALGRQETATEIRLRGIGGGVWVVDLRGYVDAATHGLLDEALGTLVADGRTRIVVNFAGLTFADSSGIGDILEYAKEVRDAGGDLKFLGLQGIALAIFQMLEMDRVFEVLASEEDAIASFDRGDEPIEP